MQFQSDLLQTRVVRPKITETTALGSAYLAGLAVKYWNSIDEVRKQWQVETVFSPGMDPGMTDSLIKGWHRAVRAAEAWASEQ